MKICLISAPTANQFDGRAIGEMEAARIMGELAPVGILSLAAVLEAKACSRKWWTSIASTMSGSKNRSETRTALKPIFAVLPDRISPLATLIFSASVRFAAVIP